MSRKIRTIKLRKHVDIINERGAGEAITPGMLLEFTAADTYIKGTATATQCPKIVALEDELQGRTIDDDYAVGDPVQAWNCVPGEEANLALKTGETIVIGDALVSAGDGTVKKGVAGTDFVVGYAGEAITASVAGEKIATVII